EDGRPFEKLRREWTARPECDVRAERTAIGKVHDEPHVIRERHAALGAAGIFVEAREDLTGRIPVQATGGAHEDQFAVDDFSFSVLRHVIEILDRSLTLAGHTANPTIVFGAVWCRFCHESLT